VHVKYKIYFIGLECSWSTGVRKRRKSVRKI